MFEILQEQTSFNYTPTGRNMVVGIDIETSYNKTQTLFSIIVAEYREKDFIIFESFQETSSKMLPDINKKLKELESRYSEKYNCKILVAKY